MGATRRCACAGPAPWLQPAAQRLRLRPPRVLRERFSHPICKSNLHHPPQTRS